VSAPPDPALVIGLGNRLRGDDGVGPRVAELVAERAPELEVIVCEREPTELLLHWRGARLAMIVDAVAGPSPGAVHRIELGSQRLGERQGRTSSTHALALSDVIELGRELGRMPRRLVVYGIEAERFEAGAGLSPPVAACAGALADTVITEARAERPRG
jgi:hydrogenase maturation protease